jgi:pilus assembly protein CpaE
MSTTDQRSGLTILTLDADPITRRAMADAFAAQGFTVASCSTGEEAEAAFERGQPDLVVLDGWTFGDAALAIYRRLRNPHAPAQVPIIFLYPAQEIERVRSLARWIELDEYVARPFTATELVLRAQALLARCGRFQTTARPKPTEPWRRADGRVIAVFSAKGGVGKTTICANLSVALQQQGAGSVVLVDGNFPFGDLAATLDLVSDRDIGRLVPLEGSLDEASLEANLATHPSGLRLLPAPPEPVAAEKITAGLVRELTELLRRRYDFVLFDTPTGYDERTLAILEGADEILLVLTPEIVPIKNTRTFLEVCREYLGYYDRVRLVLNRASGDVGVDHQSLPADLRERILGTIVSDGRTVVRAGNVGKPFVLTHPETRVAQDIGRLAEQLAPGPRQLAPGRGAPRKGGPIGWLFGHRAGKAPAAGSVSSR